MRDKLTPEQVAVKEGVKEGIKEFLNEQAAAAGWWGMKALLALVLCALVYWTLAMSGWHR